MTVNAQKIDCKYLVDLIWVLKFPVSFPAFFSSELVIGFHRRNPCHELFYHYSLEVFCCGCFRFFIDIDMSPILSRKQLLFCIIACLNLLQIAEKMIPKIGHAYTSLLSSSELMMLVCLF